MDSDWLRHFRLLLKNHCMDDHQTFHKCLSSGPEEVLLLFVAIGNPRWPPWTLIGWDIFDFFSRTIAWTITKLSTNVCLVVLKKCCYFSLRSEIQDGRLGLWLAETFSTSSQEPLHGRSPNQKCLSSCWRSVVTFRCDRKSKMAALDSDWLRQWLLSRTIAWTITKLSRNVCLVVLKKCCYFSLQSEIQDGRHGLWLAETFSTSSQEPCMDDHQTCHKCSSSGPEEVLLLFVAIGNPRWLWTLIGWDIFDFFLNHCMDDHQTSTNVCF